MRIISNFHDYYDCIQRNGFDDEIVFVRKQKVIYTNHKTGEYNYPWHYCNSWGFKGYIVGFCDNVYVILKFSRYNPLNHKLEEKFIFSLDEAINFINSIPLAKNREKHRWRYISDVKVAWKQLSTSVQKIFFNEIKSCKSPIWHIDLYTNTFTENPCLKNLGFHHNIDPYTAYQTLYSWHCNQARPEKSIPKIDDKTMLEIKGFDKYSFKKDKSIK